MDQSFPFRPKNFSKIKLVLSDLHLGAGMFLKSGEKNNLENFAFDNEFSNFIEYFSTNRFGNNYPVELILNGDILDFLNVSYKNHYFSFINEKIAFHKLKSIIKGHPVFFNALKRFVSRPNKTITYVIGNHDADLFFTALQSYLKETIGGQDFQDKISFVDKEPYYKIEGQIEIHHGHQSERMHSYNYDNPFIIRKNRKYLNLPWGSLFIMNVINKFKKERDYIDNIYPHSLFIFYLLLTDTSFAIRFMAYTFWYFLKTRFLYIKSQLSFSVLDIPKIINEDVRILEDGERAGKEVLKSKPDLYAVIMGHTHRPKEVRYPSGQMYVNTGTWMRMVNLDLRYFGRYVRQPFCIIGYPKNKIEGGNPVILLLEWKGHSGAYRHFIP